MALLPDSSCPGGASAKPFIFLQLHPQVVISSLCGDGMELALLGRSVLSVAPAGTGACSARQP
jgi:hypothetical protein